MTAPADHPVRVVVVDDQPSFRRAAAAVIELTDGFRLVGEAADGATAVGLVGHVDADLVLMDVNMPGIGGVDAAGRIRSEHPDVVVVLLSTYEQPDLPADVADSGRRYVHKERFGPDVLRGLWPGAS